MRTHNIVVYLSTSFLNIGCKIKALRAKTNTYIKTPVRGEEPVFVVTGRREDVAMARREIISAAEHFSMIRASRNKNASLNGGGGASVPGPPNLPGQTTIQVRVPYRVVGLVVGPKGATIKRIQQQTHTYIVTPSRDKEPVFEVTGMPENVDRAREEIEAHIAMRTGGFVELTDDNDFHANGTDVGFDLHGHPTLWSKSVTGTTPAAGRKPFANYRNDSSSSLGSASTDSYFGNNGGSRLADYSPPSPTLSYTANSNGNNNNNNNNANGNGNVNSNGDKFGSISPGCTDLPFKTSPGFKHTPAAPPAAPSLVWSQYEHPAPPSAAPPAMFPADAPANGSGGLGNQRSPPLQHHHANGLSQHPLARRVCSDPGGGTLTFSTFSNCGLSNGVDEPSVCGAAPRRTALGLPFIGFFDIVIVLVLFRGDQPEGQPGLFAVLRERGHRRPGALWAQPVLYGVCQPHLPAEQSGMSRLPHCCHSSHTHLLIGRAQLGHASQETRTVVHFKDLITYVYMNMCVDVDMRRCLC